MKQTPVNKQIIEDCYTYREKILTLLPKEPQASIRHEQIYHSLKKNYLQHEKDEIAKFRQNQAIQLTHPSGAHQEFNINTAHTEMMRLRGEINTMHADGTMESDPLLYESRTKRHDHLKACLFEKRTQEAEYQSLVWHEEYKTPKSSAVAKSGLFSEKITPEITSITDIDRRLKDHNNAKKNDPASKEPTKSILKKQRIFI